MIACEESQTICNEFRRLGHRAFSCDLVPCSGGHEEWHIQGDALNVIDGNCEFATQDGKRHFQEGKWDLLIAHPVCTYLTVSAEWCYNIERFGQKAIDRMRLRDEAQDFFMRFINADCDHIAVENPVGVMSTRFRKPDQIIQPWHFGDPYMKTTCLWTKGLPLLKQTHFEKPEIRYKEWIDKNGKKKRQDYESYRQSGSKDRSKNRSKTFPGIGKAIAEQYSKYLIELCTDTK